MHHNSYVWDFTRRRCIILHFAYSSKHLVWYYSDTVKLSDLNRLVHKDILPSWTPLGSSAKSYSTTAKPNNCSEQIQEGSEQCAVGAVSISCMLFTKMYDAAACDDL